ncbi:MAG: glycerophosphodiester phosphodiesterase [Anaerolineales bacterium]
MLPETFDYRERPVTLIHHAAHCKHKAPPGSLSALETCLNAGSIAIEIDVIPLADGQFALLHDQNLETETNGDGIAHQKTRAEVEKLYYTVKGEVTSEKVGFLEDAVDLLQEHPDTQRLQLDLKPFAPLTQAVLRDFTGLIKPVIHRIQVTSVADWAVRSLARFSQELTLGFDPLLYLDMVDEIPRPKSIPPFRVGAYNLLDDHPLSSYQWGPLGDYFAARAAALLVQAPAGCEWFIRAELLKVALTAGFDWIAFLHHHGSKVDAWTIDVEDPEQIELAQQLVNRGIDDLTTDTPSRLAAYLPSKSIC